MVFQAGTSTQITDKVQEILENARPCLTKCECKIFSKDDSSVSVTPMKIEQMTIVQNFETAYSDVITLTISVEANEAIVLLTNYKNLKCTLTFNRYDEHIVLQDDILPEIKQYMVVIANALDLLKQYTKAEMTNTDNPGEKSSNGSLPSEGVMSRRITLELQLIDEDVYIRRDRPFNFILQNATMVEAIHYVANLLEIKNVWFRYIDNERTYDNFVIPPMQTFATIFSYLQEHFGVYAKGLSSYYTGGDLYIYPPFDVKTDSNYTIHLYKVQEGSYPGCPSYHTEDGSEISIILNDKIAMENLSEKTSDEVGNYQVALRAESIHDVGKEFNGRECKIRDNNLLSIASENNNQPQTGKVSARYTQATNNAYTMSSMMAQTLCKILGATWISAWPFVIKPGARVVYHSEEYDAVKVCNGIISSVTYNMQIANTVGLTGKDNIYAFSALLMVRLTQDVDPSWAISSNLLSIN